MDFVLDICRTKWPKARFIVLSSENRFKELDVDPRISEVLIIKTSEKGFPRKLNLKRAFHALVVPVGNLSGSGYGNVFAAANHCFTHRYYIMPYGMKLNRVSVRDLKWGAFLEKLLFIISYPLARIAAELFKRND